jgi:hypothetical protein
LRHSQLYRSDQHSYILYPDRKLAGFLDKNTMTSEQVGDLALIAELAQAQDKTLIIKDENGNYHFSGQIHNLRDVKRSLETLKKQTRYAELVKADSAKIVSLFEDIFHHDEFTGRSGTFFAYEGLGSIYWHMVSKLLLAVQETILRTRNEPSIGALLEKYADIRKGLGFNKSPAVYGAFPTDPYSHTPKGQGARQPGMTGAVKEEILTRQTELGFFIENGFLTFDFLLFNVKELLSDPSVYSYWGIDGQQYQIELQAGCLAYSVCQVPVIIQGSNEECITIHLTDGDIREIPGHRLDADNSQHIFRRKGKIHHLVVSCRIHQ